MLTSRIIPPTDRKYKKLIIEIGFPKDGHLGCKKGCSFCFFRMADYNKLLIPSDEDLEEYLSGAEPHALIHLSGAGDPLYDLEGHKDLFFHIIDFITDRGFDIQLVTKYPEVVAQEGNKSLKKIKSYVFSTEVLDDQLLSLIQLLNKNDIYVRVAKVYNMGPNIDSINHNFILKYIEYYSNVKNLDHMSISLRCNYNYPEDCFKWIKSEREGLDANKPTNSCRVALHTERITTPVLGRNQVIRCYHTHEMIETEMNVKLKDLLK